MKLRISVFTLFALFCFNGSLKAQEMEELVLTRIKTYYKVNFEGELLFERECAGCHGIQDKVIAAPLAEVHKKRPKEWVLQFLMNPASLEFSDDEHSTAYRDEYGSLSHQVSRDLGEKEYNQILDFIESESDGEPDFDKSKLKEDYYAIADNHTIKSGDYYKYLPKGGISYHLIYSHTGLPWEIVEVNDRFGDKRDPGTLKNGNGTILKYDEYANLESSTNYINGIRTGSYIQYFDGGQKELQGNYTNGKANGVWTYYYTSGEIKNQINYIDGRIISNKEGDRPDYQPGVSSKSVELLKNNSRTNNTTTTPVQTQSVVVQKLYPSNEKIEWESPSSMDVSLKSLGAGFFDQYVRGVKEDIYANASPAFRTYHPPTVMDNYFRTLEGLGGLEYYQLNNVGKTTVNGKTILLFNYIVKFASREINMYLNFVDAAGGYVLDGWSFDLR